MMDHSPETHIDVTEPVPNDHDKPLSTPAWLGGAGVLVVLLLIVLTGGGMMVMGPGMMLGGPLLLIGLVALAAWLLRSGQLTDVMSKWDHPHSESARDILDARYARGELSDDEYDRMRRNLG